MACHRIHDTEIDPATIAAPAWTPLTLVVTLDGVKQMNPWLESDEAHGRLYYENYPAFMEPTVTIWFSDPATAFNFRLRFT